MIEEKAQQVYYDPKTHNFRTVRERDGDEIVVSGPTSFYGDSKTTKRTTRLPAERFEDFEPVRDPSEFPYTTFSENVNGWKIEDIGPNPASREELLARVTDENAIDVTGLEGLEFMLATADKIDGCKIVVEGTHEQALLSFFTEYETKIYQSKL